eukprot:SAG31_NODE_15066_length_772_cov_1.367013_1_plen_83_part_01
MTDLLSVMDCACLRFRSRDEEYFDASGLQNGAKLRLNKPQKLGLVLTPEHPWEMAELGGYDQVGYTSNRIFHRTLDAVDVVTF